MIRSRLRREAARRARDREVLAALDRAEALLQAARRRLENGMDKPLTGG